MARVNKILLIAFLGFVFFQNTAYADYVAFQNKFPIPPKIVGTDFPQYRMNGTGALGWTVSYTATNTITQFDRVDIPFCRFGGTETGEIQLEVRSSTTTGPIIASSTLQVNDGNVSFGYGCGAGAGQPINATTSTFVLNKNIQTLEGVSWYFRFRFVGTDSTIYFSLRDSTISENGGTYVVLDSTGNPLLLSGLNYSSAIIGRALGTEPSTLNLYNASSTVVVCDTFDVGCYFSSALSWAFVLPDGAFDPFIQLKDDLKDHAPWGYFTSAYSAINNLSATGTPAFTLATSSPITTYVFNPIRTGINWLLLLGGVFWLYKRSTDIII